MWENFRWEGGRFRSAVSELCSCRGPGLFLAAALGAVSLAAGQTTTVSLSWTDNSADEAYFRVERRTLSGPFQFVANAPATAGTGSVTAYADATASLSTAYVYRVRAENATGESAWSEEVTLGADFAGGTAPGSSTGTSSGGTTSGTSTSGTTPTPVPLVPIPIAVQPVPLTVSAGQVAMFTVSATGSGLSYQWRKNGTDIAGQTRSSLYLDEVAATDAGAYSVMITAPGASSVSAPADLAVVTAGDSRITATSVRGYVDKAVHQLIPGLFVVGTGEKRVLVRGVGPELANFGVTGYLADPVLSIHKNGAFTTGNDNWGSFSDQSGMELARRTVGAFPLKAGSRDASMIAPLAAGVNYTTPIWNRWGSGIALTEIYDLDPSSSDRSVARVSARALVDGGDKILTQGIVISGTTAMTLLIRGVGPGLLPQGVTGVLMSPSIELYRGSGGSGTDLVAANTRWELSDRVVAVKSATTKVGAPPLVSGSGDAALLVAVPPGVYTVQLKSLEATSGTAEIQVYVVP